MALTNIDISHLINPFQRCNIFKGVYACDMLPKKFSLPAGFVVNLSPHTSRGSHWIGIFFDNKKTAHYFDSFGFPPTDSNILKFINSHSLAWDFNRNQYQHINSYSCGKFVILFILCRMYEKDVDDVFKKFSTNLFVNELVIEKLFSYFKELRKNKELKKILF